MPFVLRPDRRFPVQCSVRYHAGPFLTLPLAYVLGFGALITLQVLSSIPAYAEWVAIGFRWGIRRRWIGSTQAPNIRSTT
jgi:hypothetical protein